jgi:hypothetical protein
MTCKGGNRQGGISPSRKSPNIFLFSDPRVASLHGYEDNLDSDPIKYFGEGQSGDMEISHGNLAIMDHDRSRRALRLLRVHGSEIEYLGEFELDPEEPYVTREAGQTGTNRLRKAIIFRLRRA